MKKKIYKFVSVAVIAVAMVVSFQMSKAKSNIEFSLNKILSEALAIDEFATQPDTHTKNVLCIKEINISLTGGGIKFGHRDKCKPDGDGCNPTVCA